MIITKKLSMGEPPSNINNIIANIMKYIPKHEACDVSNFA